MEDHSGGVSVPNAKTERIKNLDDAMKYWHSNIFFKSNIILLLHD